MGAICLIDALHIPIYFCVIALRRELVDTGNQFSKYLPEELS